MATPFMRQDPEDNIQRETPEDTTQGRQHPEDDQRTYPEDNPEDNIQRATEEDTLRRQHSEVNPCRQNLQ